MSHTVTKQAARTNHAGLRAWVEKIAALTQPDEIYWCHGIYGTLEPGQGEEVAIAARKLEGTPYSYTDYAALILRRFRIPAPKLRAYIAATHHQICSQLCDTAHALAGRVLFEGRWPGYVTPYDLYQLDQSITGAPGVPEGTAPAITAQATPPSTVMVEPTA